MSDSKSDSNEGPHWIVYIIAGFLWQGVRTISRKPSVTSTQVAHSTTRAAIYGINSTSSGTSAVANASGNREVVRPPLNLPTTEHMKLRNSLTADQRTVNIDWALGEVKNQEREGACTAFALSAAVEVLLQSRYQIEARIDAQRFWRSYKVPSITSALKAASSNESELIAEVKAASKLHPYEEGTKLQISIGEKDFSVVPMSKIVFAFAEKKPVVFLSGLFEDTLQYYASTGFIPARRGKKGYEHAWLMTGVSRGLKSQGDVWFHMRNSWGAEWGRNGNAYLNALHCTMNSCDFLVINSISISEIRNPIEMDTMSGQSDDLIDFTEPSESPAGDAE